MDELFKRNLALEEATTNAMLEAERVLREHAAAAASSPRRLPKGVGQSCLARRSARPGGQCYALDSQLTAFTMQAFRSTSSMP